MAFSPAMRFTALALMGLFVAGLLWRGFGIYQEEQRAQQAALLDREASAQSGSEPAAKSEATATALPGGTQAVAAPPPADPQPALAKGKLVVHVDGAVRRPGVYTLEEGARVNDAVAMAGGALPDGLPGALNLAAPLTDGAKVYIFSKAEIQAQAAPAPQPVEARGATYSPVKSTETAASPAASKPPAQVDINTAATAELEAVPGIGPATARAILEHRTKHGPFKRVDDLTAVSGIGPKTLEKLRPYLKV